ncbi:MAG: RNA methyltransferase [Bdellovibrionales bacterium]|nr:RNA methyltransferase [Bdellovibrionales bacterium]
MHFDFKGHTYDSEEVFEKLSPILTPDRRERISQVVASRTRNFIPVLEKIFDQGNINAVFRSAESLGFQDVHMIDNQKIKISKRISKGSDKWLNVSQWDETTPCLKKLKADGYKVLVTHLDASATSIYEWDFTQKTALVFGSEGFGVSEEAIQLADQTVILPMEGFTQSYNISVAAALCMFYVNQQRKLKLGSNADLSREEQRLLEASYYLRTCNETMKPLVASLRKE